MDDHTSEVSQDSLELELQSIAEQLPPENQATDISIEDIIAEFHEDIPPAPVSEKEPDIFETQEVSDTTSSDVTPEGAPVPPEEAPASEEIVSPEDQNPQPVPPPETVKEAEQPVSSGPIIFKPRYRGSEMRKQIVNGPERRYYELQEMGLGKLQLAILLCTLAFCLSACTTALYHFHILLDTHLRLYIFSQVFSIFVAAILGCYLLMDGISDMFQGHFSLNTFLAFTLLVCAADCIVCLKKMWLPYGSVLCLEMAMALWGTYCKRSREMGQTDTLRKANLLDALVCIPDVSEGKNGFLRRDGLISDYTDAYAKPSAPEKVQSVYGVSVLALSMAIAGLAYFRKGGDYAIHIMAGAMLCALPASFFLTLPRPAAILEQRLHKLGALLCGWTGVKGLTKKGLYALSDDVLFPAGSLSLNGVKFYGDKNPDQIIGYASALADAQGSQWAPILSQLLDSRNANHYVTEDFLFYDNGGVGGIINGETVLMGTKTFMKEMKIDIPSGSHVEHPLYISIDGDICAVFAPSYHADRLTVSGLSALKGCRNITGVYVGTDTLVDKDFLYDLFRVKPKRLQFPMLQERFRITDTVIPEKSPALMLTIRNHLAAKAYCISGARSLRSSVIVGTVFHIAAGALGLLAAAAIAFLGNSELLTAGTVLLYNLLWLIPGFIITEWTRFL